MSHFWNVNPLETDQCLICLHLNFKLSVNKINRQSRKAGKQFSCCLPWVVETQRYRAYLIYIPVVPGKLIVCFVSNDIITNSCWCFVSKKVYFFAQLHKSTPGQKKGPRVGSNNTRVKAGSGPYVLRVKMLVG